MAVQIVDQNNLVVNVTPTANQTITIDRGVQGPVGPPGPNTIGGYGFNISGLTDFNALMFRTTTNQWTNIPQEEISDGGNF
jgi:hypothetical protein